MREVESSGESTEVSAPCPSFSEQSGWNEGCVRQLEPPSLRAFGRLSHLLVTSYPPIAALAHSYLQRYLGQIGECCRPWVDFAVSEAEALPCGQALANASY